MFISSISKEQLDQLENASFPGKIYVVDKEGPEFSRAIAYLRRQKILGFDTETRPCFSPSQPRYGVSLLQLSGAGKAFLFRIKSLGMHRRLCSLLADPKIIKVGAAVHDDIKGLQKYPGFFCGSSENCLGIRDKRQKRQEDVRDNSWIQDIEGAAAFQLGGGSPFRIAGKICGHRCVGMP